MTEELENTENNVPEESIPNLSDFIPEASEFEVPDLNTVVKIITSGGEEAYVPTPEATTVGQVMLNSNLRQTGAVQYWLNGAQVDVNTVIAPGSTLTIVGSVKGG